MIGCGASLLEQMDVLPMLKDEVTWGVNYLPLWPDLPFDLDYYSISEDRHLNRYGIRDFEWPGHKMVKFAIGKAKVRREGFQWVAKAPGDVTIHNYGMVGLDDDLAPIPAGFCTTANAIQLAAWMGFTEFFLVGNEFTRTGYAWDPRAKRRYDDSMFVRIAGSFRIMRQELQRAGRSIADCTHEGRLTAENVLDYVPIKEAVNGRA
jgi:hypothetical protein